MTNELTRRQMFGEEYMQYTKEIPRSISKTISNRQHEIIFMGKTKEPPEIGRIQISPGFAPTFIYYDLEEYKITDKKTKKSIDVVAITPGEWSQKVIDFASPEIMPPEAISAVGTYATFDFYNQQYVTASYVIDKTNLETRITEVLWHTLLSRFIAQRGVPLYEADVVIMRDAVIQRRQEVLDSLQSKDDSNPTEISLRPFN